MGAPMKPKTKWRRTAPIRQGIYSGNDLFLRKNLHFAVYSLQSAHGYYTAAKGSHRLPHQLHAEERLLALVRGDCARTGPHIAGDRSQTCDQPAEQGAAAAGAQPQPVDRGAASALQQEGLRPPAAGGADCGGQADRGHRDGGDDLAGRHHRQPRGLRAGGARRLHARRAHCERRLRTGGAHSNGARGRDHCGIGGRLRRDAETLLPRGRDDSFAALKQGDGADLRARRQRRHPGQGAGNPAQVRLNIFHGTAAPASA